MTKSTQKPLYAALRDTNEKFLAVKTLLNDMKN